MVALGFASSLPYFLIFDTLSAWFRASGISLEVIGFFSLVTLVATFKFLWAPIVDRTAIPVLTRSLGHRRSWMLVCQIALVIGLWSISASDPTRGLGAIAVFAVLVGFASATQDIAIDAWRIESATMDKQGAMAAAYQVGYRTALMVASAGALIIADESGFRTAYLTMAGLVSIGILTTLLVREPERKVAEGAEQREQRVVDWLAARAHWPPWMQQAGAWFIGAVLGPILDFFGRYGLGLALTIFAFISTYRLTDYVMGTMTNTFYIDMGFTLTEVGVVAKFFGWPSTLVGAVLGGILVAKIGTLRGLFLGSVLIIISNIFYASYGSYACEIPLECARAGIFDFWPSWITPRGEATNVGLSVIVGFDNLALGVHGTALIAFMSSLTSSKYTATQYAVLSSLYALPGKLLMGTSGFMVNALGYGDFFLYTALLSIPGLLLLMWLSRRGITARN
jgi:PAT family beta-lactamase induction signal transducer AmpG